MTIDRFCLKCKRITFWDYNWLENKYECRSCDFSKEADKIVNKLIQDTNKILENKNGDIHGKQLESTFMCMVFTKQTNFLEIYFYDYIETYICSTGITLMYFYDKNETIISNDYACTDYQIKHMLNPYRRVDNND